MSNFEDILHKRLILSRPLSKNEAKKLNLANTHFRDEEDNSLPKQWFCSIDIEEWGDVEIFVQGSMEKPYEEFIEMAGKILDNLHQHLSSALKYLKEFFPTQEVHDYDLSSEIVNNRIYTYGRSPLKNDLQRNRHNRNPSVIQETGA